MSFFLPNFFVAKMGQWLCLHLWYNGWYILFAKTFIVIYMYNTSLSDELLLYKIEIMYILMSIKLHSRLPFFSLCLYDLILALISLNNWPIFKMWPTWFIILVCFQVIAMWSLYNTVVYMWWQTKKGCPVLASLSYPFIWM